MKVSTPTHTHKKSSAVKGIFFFVFLCPVLLQAQPCSLTWYRDYDGDGFGNSSVSSTTTCAAPALSGYVLNSLDCNDTTSNATSWNTTESAALSSNAINNSVLKASSNGHLFLLYRNYISASDVPVTLKEYDGTTWNTIGSDPISTEYMYGADVAINPLNEAYIAYLDFASPSSGNNKASVMRFNGSTWELLGERRFSNSLSDNCSVSIAISAANIPYVLTCNVSGQATVYQYDAALNNWNSVGGSFATFSAPKGDLKIDKAGNLYVAFTEASSGRASVMMYNGSSWSYVGASEISDNDTDIPQFIISESGRKYISYFDYGSNEIVVKKLAIGSPVWETLGGIVHTGSASSVTIAVDRYDVAYIAYRDDATSKVTIKKSSGNSWAEVATNLTEDGLNLSLTMNPATNLPAFSYQNLNQSDFASVRTLGFQITPPSLSGIANSQSVLCQGQTSTLTANGTLNHAARWNWYSGSCGATLAGSGNTLNVSPNDTTQYFVRAEGGCVTAPAACVTTLVNILDTVRVTTAVAPPVRCEGDGYNLSVQSIVGSGVSYQWYKNNNPIPGATSNAYSIPALTLADAGTYTLRATGTCNTSTSSAAVLTINSTTTIDTPLSDITACENTETSFEIEASGSSMTYQWFKEGIPIVGETFSDLEFEALEPGDAGTYSVTITGACGTVNSTDAELIVLSNPVITQQPIDATVCNAGNTVFSAQASGIISGYQWYKNGAVISGATTNELTLSSVSTSDIGTYHVSVAGDCGPILSNTVSLQINTPNYISAQPPAQVEICNNGNHMLSIATNGSGLTFQWSVDAGDGSGWQVLSGETAASLILTNVTTALEDYQYQATVSNLTEGCSVQSVATAISVVNPPAILTQPSSQSTCLGNEVEFNVVVAGNNLHYQWQEKVNGVWTNISGETSSNMHMSSASADDNGAYFRVRVSNNACAEVYSDSATLQVFTVAGEGPCLEFIISEAITPNGDGILDQWVIQGIERYPDNEVKVFNIWGDLIFETSGYRNESNNWNGKNHHDGIMDGINLPDGNYFFQLSLGDGSSLKTGFIRLKR